MNKPISSGYLYIGTVLLILSWLELMLPKAIGQENAPATIMLGAFDYPPFHWEEDNNIRGISTEIGNEIFNRLNFHTQTEMFPLKRALFYLEIGQIDAIIPLIKTEERSVYLEYTDRIMTVRGLIWTAADRVGGAVEFDQLTDLLPYRIGVTIGYSYGQELDDILKVMKVDKATTDLSNYKKLLFHRIDIFPGNEIVAKALFKKHPELQGKLIHSRNAFIKWDFYMGISKKSPLVAKIPEINRIISELKEDGIVAGIVRKYTE